MKFPLIQTNGKYYIGGVDAKTFAKCGELQFKEKWYENVRFIDSVGQEYLVESATSHGYTTFLHYLHPRKYRSVKIEFELEVGREYTLLELKALFEEFIFSKRLSGQPFLDKKNDVPLLMEKFKTIEEFVGYKWFLDSRRWVCT